MVVKSGCRDTNTNCGKERAALDTDGGFTRLDGVCLILYSGCLWSPKDIYLCTLSMQSQHTVQWTKHKEKSAMSKTAIAVFLQAAILSRWRKNAFFFLFGNDQSTNMWTFLFLILPQKTDYSVMAQQGTDWGRQWKASLGSDGPVLLMQPCQPPPGINKSYSASVRHLQDHTRLGLNTHT